MSFIKKLMVDERVATVDFPDIDGFTVDICYIGRDRRAKIRNQSLEYKFNKRTRTREEEVNFDKFLELYSEAVIKGWKGLTIRRLSDLMPIDMSGMDPNKEIPYSPEDALELLKNSTVFDQFVNDTIENFEINEDEAKEEEEKN